MKWHAFKEIQCIMHENLLSFFGSILSLSIFIHFIALAFTADRENFFISLSRWRGKKDGDLSTNNTILLMAAIVGKMSALWAVVHVLSLGPGFHLPSAGKLRWRNEENLIIAIIFRDEDKKVLLNNKEILQLHNSSFVLVCPFFLSFNWRKFSIEENF